MDISPLVTRLQQFSHIIDSTEFTNPTSSCICSSDSIINFNDKYSCGLIINKFVLLSVKVQSLEILRLSTLNDHLKKPRGRYFTAPMYAIVSQRYCQIAIQKLFLGR